eukprot:TRINITY_DN8125_c0_g1_i1.p1 TRINITY_DN8125_c0_g1~~TRINITY_DN8125_c0_g1_i1.p1  ORF type:complete len:286 (+),score=43.41 TRINITY_DN8125_c0_g1_i1:54-860(+)
MLSLFSLLTVAATPSIRWYVPGSLNVSHVEENRNLYDGLNYCCGLFKIDDNGVMTNKNVTEVKDWTAKFQKLGLDVFLVGTPSEMSILSGKASSASGALIDFVKSTGANGVILDYEPSNNYTISHAEHYNTFLTSLKAAAVGKNVEVGMDVASWGILDHLDIYEKSNLDIYTSMSPTYTYSEAVAPKGVQFVHNMSAVFKESARYGIGSSASTSSGDHCTFNWTGSRLYPWLTQLPVPAIDIWRCDIDHPGESDADFLDALRKWKSQS